MRQNARPNFSRFSKVAELLKQKDRVKKAAQQNRNALQRKNADAQEANVPLCSSRRILRRQEAGVCRFRLITAPRYQTAKSRRSIIGFDRCRRRLYT